jgi:S-adenosyl-L-methionine hydrolase (adenosine-forming)
MQQETSQAIIALMTDFGLGDGDVGVMKGVMLSIAPAVHLVDLTHDVAPQNVLSGAWILGASYRYFPEGTVFTCVVDPGVGSTRRAIALHAGKWFFVGPDNGVFSFVLTEQSLHEAVSLTNPMYQLPQVSSTFHGRDIFAPAAAHIAHGVSLAEFGSHIDPADLIRLEQVYFEREGEVINARIIHVDNFGNLITSIPLNAVPDLFSSPTMQLSFAGNSVVITERRRFFADTDATDPTEARPFIYGDSSGYVGIAVRNGNAARTVGVGYGASITLTQ